ncbi:MAG: hypothetical protein WC643_02240 [Parcubacteria group bacterium]|jgi:hypothetical protein
MQKKKLFSTIAVVIIVGAGAFFGGTVYEKDKLSSQGLLRSGNMQQGADGQRRPGGAGGFAGAKGGAPKENGGFVTGEIISKDEKGITVKTPDGGSKIIFFAGSTAIGKTAVGSASDLADGQQVMASGKNNSDGTLSADNIQIR